MDTSILVMNVFVAVVLPVSIVWITLHYRNRENARRAEVLLAAIKSGHPVPPSVIDELSSKKPQIKRRFMERLQGGCISAFMGLSFLAFALVRYLCYGKLVAAWFLIAAFTLLGIGLGLVLTYVLGRRFMAGEIAAEEKAGQQGGAA